ncbi:MAG: DUF4419 domain-containing protein [Nitrospira sp.]|nr:DUF4419 domain-containing protein [Nitrospira sp.]
MSDLTVRQSDHASILHRSANEICFRVDDVEPSARRSSLRRAKSKVEETLGRPLLAFSHDASSKVIWGPEVGEHGLVNAVHLAFSEHRPLILTPDVIWLALAQGFAQHINNHAEALRSRFVDHKGRVSLSVSVLEIPSSEEWPDVVEQWSAGIEAHVRADLYQRLICNFSTTTAITRTASQVAMMNAFQQYFEYELMCICGIPSVTLKGTVDDWVEIRARVDLMADYHLEWWTDRIKHICDALVESAEGAPSLPFWRHIYKPKEVYGGNVMTGWLANLFPYVKDYRTNAPTVRNPFLSIRQEEVTIEEGISPGIVPNGLSRAPVVVRFQGTDAALDFDLIAGFIGVKGHHATGHVEPDIGWAVCKQVT